MKKLLIRMVSWGIDLCVFIWAFGLEMFAPLTPEVAHNIVLFCTILLCSLVPIMVIAAAGYKNNRGKREVLIRESSPSWYKSLSSAGTIACIVAFVWAGLIRYAVAWSLTLLGVKVVEEMAKAAKKLQADEAEGKA